MNPPAYDQRQIDEILNDAARVATRVAAAERDLIRAQDEQDAVYAAVKDMLLSAGEDSTHWTSPDGLTEYTATHGDYGRIQVTETISRDRLADILVGRDETGANLSDDDDPAAWPTLNHTFADSIPIRITGREPVVISGRNVVPIAQAVREVDEAREALRKQPTPSDDMDILDIVARINAKLADPGRPQRQAIPTNVDDYRDTINLVDEGQVAS